jgi:hypothetical protein
MIFMLDRDGSLNQRIQHGQSTHQNAAAGSSQPFSTVIRRLVLVARKIGIAFPSGRTAATSSLRIEVADATSRAAERGIVYTRGQQPERMML